MGILMKFTNAVVIVTHTVSFLFIIGWGSKYTDQKIYNTVFLFFPCFLIIQKLQIFC